MAITFLDEPIKESSKITYLDDNKDSNIPEKKNPWSAIGAEITPQMKEQNPVLSAIAQTGQDVIKIPSDFINQFLLNAPRALLNKSGYSFPETTNPVAKNAANAAGIAGGIMNPLKIKNPILAGAAYGSLYSNPDNISLDIKSLLNRATSGTVGAAGGAILSGIGKSLNSGDVINRFIGTRKKDFLFGRNPGQAVADERIVASNPEDLSSKIGDKLNEYGKKIDDALFTSSTKKVDITDSLTPLDKAINIATENNNQALVTRLNDAKTAITNHLSLDGNGKIQVQFARKLDQLSPQEATQVKRIIGEMTKFTGNPSEDKFSNIALKNVYGAIRNKIEQVVPEVSPLNQKYADLKVAQIAIGRKDFSKTPITSILGGLGRGAIVGGILGHGNPLAAAIGAGAETALERATNNAGFKTSQALLYNSVGKLKNRIAANNQELLGISNILNKPNNQ